MKPTLERSLAYVALRQRHRWLGDSSPLILQNFLLGAEWRVNISGAEVPTWRVCGPPKDPEFSRPLLAKARVGRSWDWAMAMKVLYRADEDGAKRLLRLMRTFVREHGLDETPLAWGGRVFTFEHVIGQFATRPGMYLGSESGWDLRACLTGMHVGGDWLALPRLPGLRRLVQAIERRSMKDCGTPWGIYLLSNGPELLESVGARKLSPGPDGVLR